MQYIPEAKKTIHYLITCLFMFGFHFIPAPEPLTPFGMGVLGVFIGAVYGWSTLDILWPSLLGLAALSVVTGPDAMFAASFGNSTVPLMIVLFVFLAMLDYYGVTKIVANFLVFNRLTYGRPLVLIFLLFLGAYIIAPINAFVGIFLFLSFTRELMKTCDIKMPSKLSMLILVGLALATMLGQIAVPFLSTAIILNNAFGMMTGAALPYGTYMAFMIPMDLVLMIIYTFMIKWVFRADVSKLALEKDANRKKEKVTIEQKVALIFTVVFLVLAFLMAILPKTSALYHVLNQFGLYGIISCCIAVAMLFSNNNKKFFDFGEFAKNAMNWDVILLSALIMGLSSYMSAEETGIQPFLAQWLAPLTSFSPMVFVILIIVVAAVITNFMNNTVICVIVMPVIMTFSTQMDINAIGTLMLVFITTQFALFTPGASPFAAIIFGQKDMVITKDLMKYALISFVALLIISLIIGIPYSNVIFE